MSFPDSGSPIGGNLAKVLLDLNDPDFQTELFQLDAPELRKVFKTLQKINAMTWNDVFKDHGLKWEAIKSLTGKYTLRLSQSYRAVVLRQGAAMRVQSLHLDHDGAYGKK